jgi:hypothetical protein
MESCVGYFFKNLCTFFEHIKIACGEQFHHVITKYTVLCVGFQMPVKRVFCL